MIVAALIVFAIISAVAAWYLFEVIRPIEKEQEEYFRKNESKDFRNL